MNDKRRTFDRFGFVWKQSLLSVCLSASQPICASAALPCKQTPEEIIIWMPITNVYYFSLVYQLLLYDNNIIVNVSTYFQYLCESALVSVGVYICVCVSTSAHVFLASSISSINFNRLLSISWQIVQTPIFYDDRGGTHPPGQNIACKRNHPVWLLMRLQ